MAEYRIDELAAAAGATVRNVRSYQEKGLLPPPRRQGRVAIYEDHHLARLRLLTSLLDRGFSLALIADLIASWEEGLELGDVLGLEDALVAPDRLDEQSVTIPELLEIFTDTPMSEVPAALNEAIALEILAPNAGDDTFRILRPRIFRIGLELADLGMPLPVVLRLARHLHDAMDDVSGVFVDLVLESLGSRVLNGDAVRAGEAVVEEHEALQIVRRLRPLVRVAVDAELARAMEARIATVLGQLVDGTHPLVAAPAEDETLS